ncbi:hypothetical protein NDN08_001328 [Rhodosorus marinus]|uniref:tRNA pseudouridine(55) synthase n=1 Tax=Rhodosorus marinus TaxID=101924 RepID=A0AAV8UTA3_9RHOD|nr:hypothetical protein NDN08_001328 [Rhodosorus marinus]
MSPGNLVQRRGVLSFTLVRVVDFLGRPSFARCPAWRSNFVAYGRREQATMTMQESVDHGTMTLSEFMSERSGIFAVDKPTGISSHAVVDRVRKAIVTEARSQGIKVRKLLNVKCGHGGTLDPLASGVLLLAIGSATKKTKFFLSGRKTYVGSAELGSETDTQDSLGETTRTSEYSHITREDVESVLDGFRGEILQTPPAFSAKMVKGKRAYELARQGEEVKLMPKKVMITRLELSSFDNPHFEILVECSGGTYIRTLIQDIARAMNSCAHMIALRRTAQGPLTLEDTMPLDAKVCTDTVFKYVEEARAKVDPYVHEAMTRESELHRDEP